MKYYIIFLPLIAAACGEKDSFYDDSQHAESLQEESSTQQIPYVDFSLDIGNLQANGDFRYMNSSLKTSREIHTIYAQVGAFMIDTGDHNPDLLRVHFQSNYEEWVGFDEILSPVYPTQEECEEESSYCEKVDIIHGESGLVDSHEGLVGIKNVYCRYLGDSYEYNVDAWVETLDTYPPTIVSEVETLTVKCDVVDRGE